MKNQKKGQSWSIDLIIGVVIFLLLIVVFYSLFAVNDEEFQSLRQEADYAEAAMSSGSSNVNVPKIIQGNRIVKTELGNLYGKDYDDLKADLGLASDFCIVIVDETGGIIDIDGDNHPDTIGNGDIEVAPGVTCS